MSKIKNCGVMIDCSRNAVPNVKWLKGFIDIIAKMGYNTVQLYTEDTYEVTNEPQFGHMRGRFSKAELKEIDAYCTEKGIELIPCVQTLAHFNQLFVWPDYADFRDMGDVLLVDDERTYRLIENIFKTCAECFTSKNIHIGMDEAQLLGRGQFMDKHGYEDRTSILLRHLERVVKLAEKYGYKNPMMWSDMFFREVYGGDYYGKGKEVPEEVRKTIPKNVRLVYWDYYHDKEEDYRDYINQHQKLDNDLIFAGGAWKWVGFNSANERSLNFTREALRACVSEGVEDVFVTLWGDNGGECSLNAILPSLYYFAQAAKGDFSVEHAKAGFEALMGESWDDFMLCDMKVPNREDVVFDFANGAKEMLFSDCFLGKFDSYVFGDGREGKFYAKLAEDFAGAKVRSKNYGFMFESYEKLCKAMTLKYELGYRSKTAYHNGDMQELKKLASEYEQLVPLLEEFLDAFRNMWVLENKPHGFDVQDIRIGGVIQRIKSCGKRLKDYVNGELSEIPELAEPIIDYRANEEKKKQMPFSNVYTNMVTVNLF